MPPSLHISVPVRGITASPDHRSMHTSGELAQIDASATRASPEVSKVIGRSDRAVAGFATPHALRDASERSMFKVYYMDPIGGKQAPALPANAMPLSYGTEKEAIEVALRALDLDRTVWKIERPDGTVITRCEIEFVYRQNSAMP
jgi:hypothetical protein